MNTDENDYLWKRRCEVKYRAQSNRLYQLERWRIMEWRENIIKVCSIFGGTVAFTEIASPTVRIWAGAMVAFANVMSLVFGYGAKARDASKRSAEWTLLERDIDAIGERDYTEEMVNDWAARCHSIELGEPVANKWLLHRCSESAALAMGGEAQQRTKPWHERWRVFYFIS